MSSKPANARWRGRPIRPSCIGRQPGFLAVNKISDVLFGCPRMSPADPKVDFLPDGVGIDRLGDIIIHAGMKAFIRISFNGIGGHGDDGDLTVGFV
jgi:hypothetical protein